MSSPRISLVLVAYNVMPYVTEAVESALEQTSPFHQIIVVENCSTDGTKQELDRLVAQHGDRIELLSQSSNIGCGPARNVGLVHVAGEYVVFLDGDDWLELELCSTLKELAANGKPDIIIYDYDKSFIDRKTPSSKSSAACLKSISNLTAEKQKIAALNVMSSSWNKAFKMSFVRQQNLHFAEGFYEDIYWNYTGIASSNVILSSEKVLIHYRQRQSSILHTKDQKHQKAISEWARVEKYSENRKLPKNIDLELYKRAKKFIFKSLFKTNRFVDSDRYNCFVRSTQLLADWKNRLLNQDRISTQPSKQTLFWTNIRYYTNVGVFAIWRIRECRAKHKLWP